MIGTTISHYKITEKLGGGGMGVVYKAHDTRLDRTVALKFLPPDLTRDPEARKRFIHEAKSASALQHPNICPIHDIDETTDKRLFIVMDCYGEFLKRMIRSKSLAIETALAIATQVTQGFAGAHESDSVHRDFGLIRIMTGKNGAARVVDFGLSKLSGQTRSDCRIIVRLGVGMGVLYRTYDTRMRHNVALTMPSHHITCDEQRGNRTKSSRQRPLLITPSLQYSPRPRGRFALGCRSPFKSLHARPALGVGRCSLFLMQDS